MFGKIVQVGIVVIAVVAFGGLTDVVAKNKKCQKPKKKPGLAQRVEALEKACVEMEDQVRKLTSKHRALKRKVAAMEEPEEAIVSIAWGAPVGDIARVWDWTNTLPGGAAPTVTWDGHNVFEVDLGTDLEGRNLQVTLGISRWNTTGFSDFRVLRGGTASAEVLLDQGLNTKVRVKTFDVDGNASASSFFLHVR